MESKAKLLGHPIHPMLIVFPLGLLGTSVAFGIAYMGTSEDRWSEVAFWMLVAGIIGGLLAAVFGLIDWLAIPNGTRAKAIGLWHAGANVTALVLFFIAWLLWFQQPRIMPVSSFVLSVIGLVCALIGGWLGGELVDRLGIGVDAGANANAPSSLTGRPATSTDRPMGRGPGTFDVR